MRVKQNKNCPYLFFLLTSRGQHFLLANEGSENDLVEGDIMKKCGIYIIKNTVNDMVYIGQSVDIKVRWYAHITAAKNEKDLSHHTQIHQAMKNLGIDNFYYEILELCDYDKLSEREIYWIAQYNSYENGYNMTLGGESNKGETNGRALLTEEMVREIRAAYNSHIPFREVYEKYKNTISKRGLQKVWHGENWKHIMMEVYTDENRLWHATAAKGFEQPKLNNKSKACSEEEIDRMRKLKAQGMSYKKISKIVGRDASVVRKYCLFQECTSPSKIGTAIQIKNIETGLVFESITQAAKWASCSKNTISKYKNTDKSAGIVPSTGEPAHWITL